MYLQDYENENVCTDLWQSNKFNHEFKYPVHIILPQTQGNHYWDSPTFTSQVKNCCMAVRFHNFFLLTSCRLDCVINTRYHQTWCSSVNMYKAPIFSTWMIIVLGSARFTTSTGGWLSLSCFSHRSSILTTAPELEHNKTAKWMPVTSLAEWLVLTHASQICIVTKLYLISFNKSPGSVLESQNSEQKNLSRIYCIFERTTVTPVGNVMWKKFNLRI